MVDYEYCPICKRQVRFDDITIHHHQPKSQGGTLKDTMRICRCCHENLHYYIELTTVPLYNTVQKLEQHPEYQFYIDYIRSVQHIAMYSIKQIKNKLKTLQAA